MTTLTHNMLKETKRMNSPLFMYSVVRKIGSNEVMEVIKTDIGTKKKEIIFRHKEYEKLMRQK